MKNITELTWQEWQEVIEKNTNFRGQLYDLAMDNAEYWINEYLHGWCGDYSIGVYGYSYVKIGDFPGYAKWYNRVQKDFGLFSNDMDQLYAEANMACEEMGVCDFEELWDTLKEKMEEIILRRLLNEYNIDTDVLLDFVDQWIDSEIGYTIGEQENCFIDDEWRIIREVPEVVIKAHVEYIA